MPSSKCLLFCVSSQVACLGPKHCRAPRTQGRTPGRSQRTVIQPPQLLNIKIAQNTVVSCTYMIYLHVGNMLHLCFLVFH